MDRDPTLPDPVSDHISAMLTLATQKHEEAIAMVDSHDAKAIPQLRQALKLLDEVELLAEDAGSYMGTEAVGAALTNLAQQKALIQLAIKQLEIRSRRSRRVAALPLILLALSAIAAVTLLTSL
jgi:chaperonin cofactor prefoldin